MVAQRVVEHARTVDGLVGFFFEAAETERRLPPAYQKQIRAMWPDTPPDTKLSYGYNPVEVRMGPASAEAIGRYDWAITISALMDMEDAKIIWAVSHSQVNRERGPKWKTLSKWLHMHPETVKRRFERSVLTLWFQLVDVTC